MNDSAELGARELRTGVSFAIARYEIGSPSSTTTLYPVGLAREVEGVDLPNADRVSMNRFPVFADGDAAHRLRRICLCARSGGGVLSRRTLPAWTASKTGTW